MPGVPVATQLRCPRCKILRSFVNVNGGTTFRCAGCEWYLTLSAVAPTGATNASRSIGAGHSPGRVRRRRRSPSGCRSWWTPAIGGRGGHGHGDRLGHLDPRHRAGESAQQRGGYRPAGYQTRPWPGSASTRLPNVGKLGDLLMALGRFVVTANVIVTPEVLAAVVAGEPGTGGAAVFGNAGTGAMSAGKYGLMPALFTKGMTIYADSAAGVTTGPQVLYQAIGAGNLRAYVQGQDDVGHADWRTRRT